MDSLQRITICWVDLAGCLPGTILLSISFCGLSVLTVTHCFPCKYYRYSFRSSLRTGVASNFRVMSCFGTHLDEWIPLLLLWQSTDQKQFTEEIMNLGLQFRGTRVHHGKYGSGNRKLKIHIFKHKHEAEVSSSQIPPSVNTFSSKATPSTPHQIASPTEDKVFKSWSLGKHFLCKPTQYTSSWRLKQKQNRSQKYEVGLAWGEGSIGKVSAAEAWGCPWHPQKEPSTVTWVCNITVEEEWAETGGGHLEFS